MIPHWYEDFLGFHAQHHGYCKVCHNDSDRLFACESKLETSAYCGEECHAKDLLHIGARTKKKRRVERPTDNNFNIPRDVLHQMATYLSKEDIKNFSVVSRWMHRHLKTAYVSQSWWTITDLSEFEFPVGDHWSKLKHLEISDNVNLINLDLIIDAFPNITHLSLFVAEKNVENADYMMPISRLNSLVSFTTEDWSFEEDDRTTNYSFLIMLPKLTSLEFTIKFHPDNTSESPDDVFLDNILVNLVTLTTFKLSVDDYHLADDKPLLSALQKLPNLSALYVPFIREGWELIIPMHSLRILGTNLIIIPDGDDREFWRESHKNMLPQITHIVPYNPGNRYVTAYNWGAHANTINSFYEPEMVPFLEMFPNLNNTHFTFDIETIPELQAIVNQNSVVGKIYLPFYNSDIQTLFNHPEMKELSIPSYTGSIEGIESNTGLRLLDLSSLPLDESIEPLKTLYLLDQLTLKGGFSGSHDDFTGEYYQLFL